MTKPMNWSMIASVKKKYTEEFSYFLGESLNDFTVSGEGIEEYKKILEIASSVNKDILYGSKEIVYRQEFAKRLRESGYTVREEQTFYQEIQGEHYRSRADLTIKNENGECVVELKLAKRKQNFLQLADYIIASNLDVGYLVCFLRNRIELFMLLRVEERLYCYTKGLLYLPGVGRRGEEVCVEH